jgi:hypothetical protein
MTVTRADLLAILPPMANVKTPEVARQDTDDIISLILKTHSKYETEYDLISPLFDTGNIHNTTADLWDFCKCNLVYAVESEKDQTVKSPTWILLPGHTVDCKHYSLFIGGVLDSLKANNDEKWRWCYRFASYHRSERIEHVFVVVKYRGEEIWIDPVLDSYNDKKEPTYYVDEEPVMLSSLSGIGDSGGTTIKVDARMAEADFLTMVNLNLFGVKDLLNGAGTVYLDRVRQYMQVNGFDFNQLKLILNS